MANSAAKCIELHLERLIRYLEPYLSLANTAMINFIVDDLWLKELPKEIQTEIDGDAAADEAMELFWRMHAEGFDAAAVATNGDKFPNYRRYIEESMAHHLDALTDIWRTPEWLKQQMDIGADDNALSIRGHMSEKKAHEVCDCIQLFEAITFLYAIYSIVF